MTATVLDMAKKKPEKPGEKKKYPSRAKTKYAGLPVAYWDLLEGLTKQGEEYEARSVAFLTTMAVRAFLHSKGLVDEKGKPKGKPKAEGG